MAERIHHTCELLNRSFTYPEWSDYCKTQPYHSPAVYTEGDFSWNINDVCTNPHKLTIQCGNTAKVTIKTAKVKGKWYYGKEANNINSQYYYSGSPCRYKSTYPCYDTESAAIRAALIDVKKHCAPQGNILKAINTAIFNHSQLTLF